MFFLSLTLFDSIFLQSIHAYTFNVCYSTNGNVEVLVLGHSRYTIEKNGKIIDTL